MAFNAFLGKSNPEDKGKKQKIALMAVVVLILAGGAVAYFNFFYSPAVTEDISSLIEQNLPGGSSSEIPVDEIIAEIDFDAGFLESSRFQALKTFKDWPLKIEQKGRKNPFSY